MNNCPKIKNIIAQGCKLLNDDIFNDIISKKKEIKYIQMMDFTKCDYIQDKTLVSLSSIFPHGTFINYYGDEFFNKNKIYKD